MKLPSLLYCSLLVLGNVTTQVLAGTAWARLGQSICAFDENFGRAMDAYEDNNGNFYVALSSSKFTSRFHNQGKVQLYRFDKNVCLWREEGNPIEGEATEDLLGSAISLSCDGKFLAVSGDIEHEESYNFRTGFVQVYRRDGGGWKKHGPRILDPADPIMVNGEGKFIEKDFGSKVQLSCDGKLLAVAALRNIHVYGFHNDRWNEYTERIWKNSTRTNTIPFSLASSNDHPILAMGEDDSIRVYSWNGTGWKQRGSGIPTVQTSSSFLPLVPLAYDLAITHDGKRLAFVISSGLAVFDFKNNEWEQVGSIYRPRQTPSYGNTEISLDKNGERISINTMSSLEMCHFSHDDWERMGTVIRSNARENVAISSSGTVVLTSRSGVNGTFESVFWPDDKRLDCLPKLDSDETKTCHPSVHAYPEEQPITVKVSTKNVSAGAAAALTISSAALVVGLAALFIFYAIRRGWIQCAKLNDEEKQNNSTQNREKEDEGKKGFDEKPTRSVPEAAP